MSMSIQTSIDNATAAPATWLIERLGAGHMGPLTHPGEVNRLIAGCIRANPARAAEHPDATLIAA
jgi:hypothetical protein